MSQGAVSKGTLPVPYFFLSYARTPKWDPHSKENPDRWVHKFYQHLCEDILTITRATAPVGYMDRENQPGDIWPDELAQALATCRVFVPLYSPRYFDSQNCGMEWFAFSRRLLRHRNLDGSMATDAIVPALWYPLAPPHRVPNVAELIQYNHADQPARYLDEGLYGLIKVGRYRNDYKRAVLQLARRIVDVAHHTQVVADTPVNYQSLESAFELGAEDHRMQIAVLAPSISTLPNGREPGYYGTTAQAWRPYGVGSIGPLARYAADLVAKLGCEPEVHAFDQQSPYWDAGAHPIPPGICLVDPWVTLSPAHKEQIRRLNQVHDPWFSVLIPWNSEDIESARAEHELRQRLSETLGRKLESVPHRCLMAATGVPTLEDFSYVLPRMTMIMLKRFREHGDWPTYSPPDGHVPRGRIRPMSEEGNGDSRQGDGGTDGDNGSADGDGGGADE
jgi:FxsC-like protein